VNSRSSKIVAPVLMLPVLGVLGAPAFLGATATTATATAAAPRAPKPSAADVTFFYDAPQISADGEHVIWRWRLTNAGSGSAAGVVLVHRLVPRLRISRMTRECRGIAGGVSCSYGTIKAGQRRRGALTANLSREMSGTVEIRGRVAWQEGSAGQAGADADVAPVGRPPAVVPARQNGVAPREPATLAGDQVLHQNRQVEQVGQILERDAQSPSRDARAFAQRPVPKRH
jgi:hypothetical protein